MTWSWSHTQEGMQNVENAIRELDDDTLAQIYTEWICAIVVKGEYIFSRSLRDRGAFKTAVNLVENMRAELIDFIIDKTNAHAECTNGGHEAHICPFGCHRVSFDSDEPNDDEEED